MPETQEPSSMQGKMPMQDSMSRVVYWRENQLTVTFHSDLDLSTLDPAEGKKRIIESLKLEDLSKSIGTDLYLQSFSEEDVLRPHPSVDKDGKSVSQTNSDLNSPVGKYLFGLPAGQGTLVICFFHIEKAHQGPDTPIDSTPGVVGLINKDPGRISPLTNAQLLAAMPNWLNGGTNGGGDIISHGCPVIPPIPVRDSCDSGHWTITLPPKFPDSIEDASGAGVTVFVLDTLPQLSQLKAAAEGPGVDNELLQDIVENVKFNYNVLSDDLDVPDPSQPATGKDIYGRLVGFPMNDHGVFVAGIIRDLASDAQVECIRVLNDYGIGNTTMLTKAFEDIHKRMLPINPDTGREGDLYNKPVVVNMSLVATPANEELANFGYTEDSIKPARLGLLAPMEVLAGLGVVFVASAGNDSDPRDTTMNQGKRWQARYPAAFAYPLDPADPGVPQVIPVGAVNKKQEAASYSNYPGPLGIATYGGEIPKANPVMANTAAITQAVEPIDALRGVYSATLYPGLSKNDPLPFHSPPPVVYPEYQPSPASTWAYWAGTSFATPIISALAARVLENQPSSGDSVRKALLSAAPQKVNWTRLEPNNASAEGPMIMVRQKCESDEDFVEVDVAITEVDVANEG